MLGVEGDTHRRHMRRQLERRIHRRRARAVGGAAIIGQRTGEAAAHHEWVSVIFPFLYEIDFIRRRLVARLVDAVVARPQASGLRIPVEPHRIAEAGRKRVSVAAVDVEDLHGGAAGIGLDADIAGRAEGDVQPAIRADTQAARAMERRP